MVPVRALKVGVLMIGWLAGLAACATEDPAPDAGVAADAQVAPTCPTHLRFTFLAGNRTDLGWKGDLHGATIAEDAFFRVQIKACDAGCRNCRFEGPVVDPLINTQRCVGDSSQTCTADSECPPWECRFLVASMPQLGKVCASDGTTPCMAAADCGPSACRFFAGPAFPIAVPQTCAVNYFDAFDGRPPVIGNIDFQTGQVRMERMSIAAGGVDPANDGACPRCIGDPTRNDGQKGGTCTRNTVNPSIPYTAGQACDANGSGQQAAYQGEYSLDCTTPFGRSLVFALERAATTGARFELGPDQPACDGGRCWCGVCQGLPLACHSSGDCPGVPCVDYAQAQARPNACLAPCQWDPVAQRGVCETQDLLPNGMLGPPRPASCFPEGDGAEILARGSSRVLSSAAYSIELAHVSCVAPISAVIPTASAIAADRAIGLPGPMLNVYRFQIDKEYQP